MQHKKIWLKILMIFFALVAIASFVIGYYLISESHDKSPNRMFGDNLIKFGIAAFGGFVIQYYFQLKARVQGYHEKTENFLIKLRKVYNNVKFVRRMLRLDVINWNSYNELHSTEPELEYLRQMTYKNKVEYRNQMLKLMKHQLGLEALREEAKLFKNEFNIVEKLKQMESYVNKVLKEYSRYSEKLLSDAKGEWLEFEPNEVGLVDWFDGYPLIKKDILGFLRDFTISNNSNKTHFEKILRKGYDYIAEELR